MASKLALLLASSDWAVLCASSHAPRNASSVRLRPFSWALAFPVAMATAREPLLMTACASRMVKLVAAGVVGARFAFFAAGADEETAGLSAEAGRFFALELLVVIWAAIVEVAGVAGGAGAYSFPFFFSFLLAADGTAGAGGAVLISAAGAAAVAFASFF